MSRDPRSPKLHRDPPTRPPHLVDDGYLVEPEPLDARVPHHGWDASSKPIRHEFALVGFWICIGIVLFALLLAIARQVDAAPRSTAVIPTIGTSEDAEASAASRVSATPDGLGRPSIGAPHGAMEDIVDGRAAAKPEWPARGAPSPSGAIDTALVGGWATWYDDGDGLYAAAGPELRAAFGPRWRGTLVDVAGPGGLVVRVPLTDACACGDRHGLPTLLDLSADAFSELAPLSWGIVAVSIELVPSLPRTDTPDQHPEDPPPHPDDERMRDEVRGDELYR